MPSWWSSVMAGCAANWSGKPRGLLKNFAFLGVQDAVAVRAWMNRATVFCTPSVSVESGAAEGFGMVFAEAQAMGLPVVSFASGGIPEAVADGQTGFLVSERDWQALGNKILLLLRNRELWTRFSKAGQIPHAEHVQYQEAINGTGKHLRTSPSGMELKQ